MNKLFRWAPLILLVAMAVVFIYQEATAVDRTCEDAEFYCLLPVGQGGYGGSQFVLNDCWDGGLHWYCTCVCYDENYIPLWSGICTFS
jgi:hypothetical protein